jgi:hypothetical protein
MRNSHIAKRSVLGSFGVNFYVKNYEANLSIGSVAKPIVILSERSLRSEGSGRTARKGRVLCDPIKTRVWLASLLACEANP